MVDCYRILISFLMHVLLLDTGWFTPFAAMSRIQPTKDNECTMAFFNPLVNGRMEWLRIPGGTNLTLSNIMCQHKPRHLHKNNQHINSAIVVYADASYYMYNYDRWKSNDRYLSICPGEERKVLMNTAMSCTGETIQLNKYSNVSYDSQYGVYAKTIVKNICPSLRGDLGRNLHVPHSI